MHVVAYYQRSTTTIQYIEVEVLSGANFALLFPVLSQNVLPCNNFYNSLVIDQKNRVFVT